MSLDFWIGLSILSLPVLLGALIGYVTNAIAIKMLFRPLTKKMIFGIHVPFTPGIIPKQRSQLADSIGKMVSERLLTESAVKQQLGSEKFQNGLEKSIDKSIEELINKPVSSLKNEDLKLFYNSLNDILAGSLHSFFNSEQFCLSIENLLGFFIDSIAEKHIGDLLSSNNLKQFFNNAVIPILTGEKTKTKLASILNDWLLKNKNANTRVREIIPNEIIIHVIPSVKYILPGFFNYFFCWLNKPDIHNDLEEKGVLILKSIINKLNIFQKLFITMGQYDTSLESEMPAIIDDVIGYISDSTEQEETIDSFLKVLENTLDELLEKGFGDILSIFGMEIPNITESFIKKLPDIFNNEILSKKFSEVFDDFYIKNESKTLAELTGSVFQVKIEDIKKYLIEQLFIYLQMKETSGNISDKLLLFVSDFLKEQNSISIKKFLHITERKKNNIVKFIKSRVLIILDEKLPDLIESIDIRELVVKKINNLEMIQVEKLLLMVIQKHLKWINLFGALIGAFIGLSQVMLNNIIK